MGVGVGVGDASGGSVGGVVTAGVMSNCACFLPQRCWCMALFLAL